jgi:hypothetical protein
METLKPAKNDTRKVFMKCGTCSRTFCFLLNREFDNRNEEYEKAADLLAGGVFNTGHQCGMLWGSALAIGAESHRRYSQPDQATRAAINATQHVLDSFAQQTQTHNCREITHCDLTTITGMTKLIAKTFLTGFVYSPCFNLARRWAPEAIEAAKTGLEQPSANSMKPAVSCASEVVRLMGGSDQEVAMVAGFAGGMGLSGNACGALSAAIWMKTLSWCRKNPGKSIPYYNNPLAIHIFNVFKKESGSMLLCQKITGQQFWTIDEHTGFIKNGGCGSLIKTLAQC